MAANKKFELWWNNYLAVKKVDQCCRDAWDAATEAAVKNFTSTNNRSYAICACPVDSVVELCEDRIIVCGSSCFDCRHKQQAVR